MFSALVKCKSLAEIMFFMLSLLNVRVNMSAVICG